MLSKPTEDLPSSKQYIYEIKLDGQRTLAKVSKQEFFLYTRSFQNVTTRYPELRELARCLKCRSALLDGEIVALEEGIPSFELLQQRMNLKDARITKSILEKIPVIYYAFDLLELNGKSLLKISLLERKKLLERNLRPGQSVKILPFFDSKELIVKKARSFGYEGVMAKKRNSYYYPGQRTDLWLKQKFQQTDSFVIGGWFEGGRSQGFGSLLVGKYRDKELVYTGRVGTGFKEDNIRMLMETFRILAADRSPFQKKPDITKGIHWLKPKLVAEVKFKDWTKAGLLRAPVFLGLRADLRPQDCRW